MAEDANRFDGIWIGKTEIEELLRDGEARIAGENYKLTGAAEKALQDFKSDV